MAGESRLNPPVARENEAGLVAWATGPMPFLKLL